MESVLPPEKAPSVTLAKIADAVEQLRKGPTIDCPLTHRFTPGMYVREVRVPKGALVITRVHKTEHPFVVSAGKVLVWSPGVKPVVLSAPYCGVTEPGTVRLALVLEDLVWTTFHATDKTDVVEIEKELGMEPQEALSYEENKCLLSQ